MALPTIEFLDVSPQTIERLGSCGLTLQDVARGRTIAKAIRMFSQPGRRSQKVKEAREKALEMRDTFVRRFPRAMGTDLAELLGCTPSTISHVRNGRKGRVRR